MNEKYFASDRDVREYVTACIESGDADASHYDLDRIVKLAFNYEAGRGFYQCVSVETFWFIVKTSVEG